MSTRDPNLQARDGDAFDSAMRARYAQGLHSLPPSTAGALRAARRTALAPATRRKRTAPAWQWAGAFAAVAALALGLRFVAPGAATTAMAPQVAAADAMDADGPAADIEEIVATLDENPDMYLWLAVNDDLPPTREP
ncbi:hypothetical protein [Lysobacter sp. A3-1-A15]|uniref:hypothetical protein n=1 Tax=Novilysobacter viscosus TaxID=3098602 RepID=UPI002ED943B3